jgi:glyoxylase-like metal-dependent hydrolase (beta-lactamase superfamily II)
MKRSYLLATLQAFVAVVGFAATSVHAAPLDVQVIQTSEGSLFANITLIKGQKSAVLVDAPFTRSDAHRIVAAVLESGKSLDTIIVTHDHPDHFFSVEVLTDAFPSVRVVAAPAVVDDIWKSIPLKLKRWGPMLDPNGPRHPTAPTALEQPYVELEGHRIEILGPMQGDHVHSTAVWVPDAKALIAGDLLFNEMHLWLGESTKDARLEWARSVDRLAKLGAALVVAGHKKPGLPDDASCLAYTRKYLEVFEKAIPKSKNAAELSTAIRSAFPQTIDVFDNFLLGNSSKVAMGEMPLWQE